MAERTLRGFAAAPGVAAGPVVVLDADAGSPATIADHARSAELAKAVDAIAAAADELDALADSLRAQGRTTESDIVETSAMMARDPSLSAAVERLVIDAGRPAPAAVVEAAASIAAELAALPDPLLAERADDVRSVGRRAAAIAAGRHAGQASGILVAATLGPADVAELGPGVLAVALAAGGVTAHAAIVARSLGVPMVVGLGPAARSLVEGETVVVDGDAGELVRQPDADRVAAARANSERRRVARERALAERDRPAATVDGRGIRVLANAASAAEVEEALAQGAEGVGLLRTELLFLDAREWPDAERHRRFLAPVLAPLRGRVATIRLLDFGGDKTPPFLAGATERGIELLLAAPDALRAQLVAIVDAGEAAGVELRVLVPMVTSGAQLEAVGAALEEVLAGRRRPGLGAMIETPAAARCAAELVGHLDFISLGTNDLTNLALGLDRESAGESPVADPRVLSLVAAAIRAGVAAGIPVEVCGEAASDPNVMPLLVGLGADELSVGAARVGDVRAAVRELEYSKCRDRVEAALLDQAGHAGRQRV